MWYNVDCVFVFVGRCLCVYSRVGASCVGRPTCVCAVWAPLRRAKYIPTDDSRRYIHGAHNAFRAINGPLTPRDKCTVYGGKPGGKNFFGVVRRTFALGASSFWRTWRPHAHHFSADSLFHGLPTCLVFRSKPKATSTISIYLSLSIYVYLSIYLSIFLQARQTSSFPHCILWLSLFLLFLYKETRPGRRCTATCKRS